MWGKYRNKHGSLDIGRRVDHTACNIASHFARAMFKYRAGYKPVLNDFTLYPEQTPKAKVSVDDQMLGFFKNLGGKGGK